MNDKPISVKVNIVIQRTEEEILIYDLRFNKAYCLNKTLALIWELCNGKNNVSEISRKVSRKLRKPVAKDLVWLAVDQLKNENLLSDEPVLETPFDGLNRRQMLRRLSLTSVVALPLISSIIAPKAVMAQSGGLGATCSSPLDCAAMNCVSTTCCAMGSINGLAPNALAFCTGNPALCPSIQTTQFCCSGSGTLGTQGACPPSTLQCICD